MSFNYSEDEDDDEEEDGEASRYLQIEEVYAVQGQRMLEAEINDYNEKLTDEDTLEDYSDLKYAYERAQGKLEKTDASSMAAYTANYNSFQNAKTAFEELDDRLQDFPGMP